MNMVYQSPPIGQEISCSMKGISEEFLLKPEKVESLLKKILIREKFEILKSVHYVFNPKGFTIMFLLAEFHVAIHTYPEYNSLYFNMYTCRGPQDAENTFNFLKEKINPEKIIFYKKNKLPVRFSLKNH